VFRKRNPTLLDRLHADDIASGAETLRDRAYGAAHDAYGVAHDAAGAVRPRVEAARDAVAPKVKATRQALAPRVEAAKDAVGPRVDAAREAVAPQVEHVRDAVQPRVEAAWGAIAPTVGAVAASALEAARQRAEEAAQATAPGRRETAKRAKRVSAALRGERPPRRWPAALFTLMLGALAGVAAGVLARRMATPVPQSSDFQDPVTRPAPLTPLAADSPPAQVLDRDEEAVALGEASVSDAPGDTSAAPDSAGGAATRHTAKSAPKGQRPAAKKGPDSDG